MLNYSIFYKTIKFRFWDRFWLNFIHFLVQNFSELLRNKYIIYFFVLLWISKRLLVNQQSLNSL